MAIEVGSSVINYSGTSPKYGSMENFINMLTLKLSKHT